MRYWHSAVGPYDLRANLDVGRSLSEGRFHEYRLAIGHLDPFGWIQNIGRRRRILLQTRCGNVRAVCAFLDPMSSIARLLPCRWPLLPSSDHRARPIEGGFVASQCISCHARPVPLAHALASHRLVRAGRSTRLPVHV